MRRPGVGASAPASRIPARALALDPAMVVAVGVLRAAVDAVNDHPAVVADFDRARLEGAVEAYVHEVAALLRRTAEARARAADPAPF